MAPPKDLQPDTVDGSEPVVVAPLSKRITSGPSKPRRSNNSQPKTRPFVAKLWSMVNDKGNAEYIHWMPDGKSFEVVGRELFEKNVLPKYFKHSNFSSFVRQLNMYGWHKVQDVTSGAMQSSDEKWQFQSPNFIRDREDLLDNIVRNRGSKGSDDEDEIDLNRIFEELNVIKDNQASISQDLYRIRKDNEMLWTENYQSQERHKKHAETLDRILRFLASIYGNQGKLLADIISPMKQGGRLLLPGSGDSSSAIEPITELDTNSNNTPNFKGTTGTPGSTLSHDRLMSINSSSIDPISEIVGSPDSIGGVTATTTLPPSISTTNTTTNLTTIGQQLDPNSLALTPYDSLSAPGVTTGQLKSSNVPAVNSTSISQRPPVFPDLSLYNDTNSLNPNIINPSDDMNDHNEHANNFAHNPSPLDEKLLNSSKDIINISRHIDSQGSSLQQVQDWIQKIVPSYIKESSVTPPEDGDEDDEGLDTDDLNNMTSTTIDATAPGPLDSQFNVDEFLVDPSGTPNFDMTNAIDGGFNIDQIDGNTSTAPEMPPLSIDIPPTSTTGGPIKKRRKVSDKK